MWQSLLPNIEKRDKRTRERIHAMITELESIERIAEEKQSAALEKACLKLNITNDER